MTTETTTTGDVPKVKANAIVKVVAQHEGGIEITVRGHAPMVFDPRKAAMENRRYAEFHGWKQRFVDAAAVSADTDTGKTDPAAKYANIKALIEYYESPEAVTWAKPRAEGGGAPRVASVLGSVIPALIAMGKARDVDHGNKMVDALAAKMGKGRDDALKALAGTKDVAQKIAEMRLAQKAFAVQADDLLAGLE